MLFVAFVVKVLDKINRPSHLRRAICFDLSYLSTSKASPNDTRIVNIIIIVIGKLDVVNHRARIIAQSAVIEICHFLYNKFTCFHREVEVV